MHTIPLGVVTEHQSEEPGSWVAHHNGDFSGDVTFEVYDLHEGLTRMTVKIPFVVVKRLVAEWVRDQRVSQLEGLSDAALLLGGGSVFGQDAL